MRGFAPTVSTSHSEERPFFSRKQVREKREFVVGVSFIEHLDCSALGSLGIEGCEPSCSKERITVLEEPVLDEKGRFSIKVSHHGGYVREWQLYLADRSIEPSLGGLWCTEHWLERIE